QRPRNRRGLRYFRRTSRLLQRVVDRGELVVQVRAETVHDRDDRQRNAGRDEAVFDSGGAGLILHETRNQVLHKLKLHVHVAARTSSGLAGVLSTVTIRLTLRSGNFGAVNSVEQTCLQLAVLAHSKFGIKRFATIRTWFRTGII